MSVPLSLLDDSRRGARVPIIVTTQPAIPKSKGVYRGDMCCHPLRPRSRADGEEELESVRLKNLLPDCGVTESKEGWLTLASACCLYRSCC